MNYCHTRSILNFQLCLNSCKSQLARWTPKWYHYQTTRSMGWGTCSMGWGTCSMGWGTSRCKTLFFATPGFVFNPSNLPPTHTSNGGLPHLSPACFPFDRRRPQNLKCFYYEDITQTNVYQHLNLKLILSLHNAFNLNRDPRFSTFSISAI